MNLSLWFGPLAIMEGEGLISYTAASHQGEIQMNWHHSLCLSVIESTQKCQIMFFVDRRWELSIIMLLYVVQLY